MTINAAWGRSRTYLEISHCPLSVMSLRCSAQIVPGRGLPCQRCDTALQPEGTKRISPCAWSLRACLERSHCIPRFDSGRNPSRHDHRILQGNSDNYTGEDHCRLDAGVSCYLRQPSLAVWAGVLYMSRRKLDRGLDGGKLTHGDCRCLDSSPAGHRSRFRIHGSG